MPDIEGQGFYELLDGVYKLGRAHSAEGQKLKLRHPGETSPRETFIDFSYHPIQDRDGKVTGIFVQAADRTDHFKAVNRQRLMVDELNHRVKNTLATVQSIARQSFKSVAPESARASFEARIKALSKAHDALSAGHWEAVDLSALIGQELAAFGGDRIEMAGPEVDLVPRAAIALAMVFHELSANAARHGALARDGGSVSIRWFARGGRGRRTPGPRLAGGRRGGRARAGSVEFRSAIDGADRRGELGGDLRLALGREGFVCVWTFR